MSPKAKAPRRTAPPKKVPELLTVRDLLAAETDARKRARESGRDLQAAVLELWNECLESSGSWSVKIEAAAAIMDTLGLPVEQVESTTDEAGNVTERTVQLTLRQRRARALEDDRRVRAMLRERGLE